MGNKNKEKRRAEAAVKASLVHTAEAAQAAGKQKEPYKGHYEFEHGGFVKMYFGEAGIYNGVVLYPKDKISDVPKLMANRWLNRGATLISDLPVEVQAPQQVDADQEEADAEEQDDKSSETSEEQDQE